MIFKIEEFEFKIQNNADLSIPLNLMKFAIPQSTDPYIYEIHLCDFIEVKEQQFHIQKDRIRIIKKDHLEKRYLYLANDPQPYAVSEEINAFHTIIHVSAAYAFMMHVDTMFASLLSLERRMYHFHEFVLHSAYLCVNQSAILFTAPSGTGKSTQADLWVKYQNGRVINGDRTLLKFEDHQLMACGWPICGSSEICFNEKYPITCIVYLSQGKENRIERLSYKETVKKLLSEITINFHNPMFVNDAMNFIDKLAELPVYHLSCTISQEAVSCLKEKMKEDGIWMH